MTSPFSPTKGWSFHNPVRIHFGRGCRRVLAEELGGRRCLIVTTRRGHRQLSEDALLGTLAGGEVEWVDSVEANPGIPELQREIDRLRGRAFDAIVGFGGGSALDSAKVLAVTLSEGLDAIPLQELLADPELHGNAQPCPLYAVPTTAGTGSEVTPYSTVWDHARKKKLSLAGPAAFPRAAFVDPALTDDVPAEVTLSTGLDAINQAAESIWNRNATAVTFALAVRALKLGFDALPRLVEQGASEADRDAMAECSLLAGLAISQTRTALCHSMSYPITAHFGVPHGLACAFTMPAVLRLNLDAEDGRFGLLARELLGAEGGVKDLVAEFDRIHARLEVSRRVRGFIACDEDLMGIVDQMYTPDRAGNNLATVTIGAICNVLRKALDDD